MSWIWHLGKLNPQDVISDQDIHSKDNGIDKKERNIYVHKEGPKLHMTANPHIHQSTQPISFS
jgi:hypothetical protein